MTAVIGWKIPLQMVILLAGWSPALGQSGPACPASRLRCIELLPTAGFREAAGTVELVRTPSPFGASVDREGRHRWDLVLRIQGLPPPAVGEAVEYVAWSAPPTLDPMIRLGAVANGETRLGPVALDKFLVLVTAEGTGAGSIVLRGTSPSMALQPEELPALLAIAAGREPAHAAHGGGEAGWTPPPMHPAVNMPAGLHGDPPDVAPWRPPAADTLSGDRADSGAVLRLADGDSLTLVAGPVRRTIGGRSFRLYGFNGQVPGPLIRVPRGATIRVGFINRTPLPTTIHWHGIRLDNAFDGVPHVTQEPVPPGGSFRYEVHFPDAGIYWYHPHHREDILQDLGLYGNLRVDGDPSAWNPVSLEQTLMLDDLLVAEEGLVPHGAEAATHALMGRFGNVLLVNGETDYRLEVNQYGIVRFWLTNVSATRTFNLSFGAAPIKIVASDVGRFEREEWVDSVVIAPAERYVVEVFFDRPGRVPVTNRVRGIDHLQGKFFPEIDTLGVVAVAAADMPAGAGDAFRRSRNHERVTAEIDRYRPHFDRPPDRELVLTMEADSLPFPLGILLRLERAYFHPVEWSGTMPLMNWATTSRQVRWILRDPATGRENEEIDWRFQAGDVVKLRLTNRADALHAMQHPIHLHGQRFLVLSQGGVPKDNLVWKDTLLIPAGESADILVDLSNPGRWMLHCHIAEHLEAGMKTIITVE